MEARERMTLTATHRLGEGTAADVQHQQTHSTTTRPCRDGMALTPSESRQMPQ